jgi:signal peptidase I
MENNKSKNVPEKSKFKKFLADGWDLLKFAIIALAVVIPIRLWIAQPFVVSGESMYPTFDNGQYLIVDEISYILGSAHRGDVVIFRYPGDTKRFFIKRIIGLPNENITIVNGEVTIINKDHPDGFKMVEPYINEKEFTGGEYTTKDNEYFVMGDNRNRSSDSRTWGILPQKLMVGKAFLRLIPFSTISYLPGNYNQ